jgi:hypothetical protein
MMEKTCKRVSMHDNNWFRVAATKALLRSTNVNHQVPYGVTIFTANLDELDYWMYILTYPLQAMGSSKGLTVSSGTSLCLLLLSQPHFLFSTPAV